MTELDLLIRGARDTRSEFSVVRTVPSEDDVEEERDNAAARVAVARADHDGAKVVRLCGYHATRCFDCDISKLSLCRTLEMSRNLRMTAVPPSVGLLFNLERLSLAHCHLQEFPACVASLRLLTSLDLSNNALRHLPQAVAGMKRLTTLILDTNRLTTLPYVLTKGNVVHLGITNNPLLPAGTPEDTPLRLPAERLAVCDECGRYLQLESEAHKPCCTKVRFATYCGIPDVPLHYLLHATAACAAFVK